MVSAVVALCFVVGISVSASEQKSVRKGSVGGFVQFFSEDILYLKNEINNLMSEIERELN